MNLEAPAHTARAWFTSWKMLRGVRGNTKRVRLRSSLATAAATRPRAARRQRREKIRPMTMTVVPDLGEVGAPGVSAQIPDRSDASLLRSCFVPTPFAPALQESRKAQTHPPPPTTAPPRPPLCELRGPSGPGRSRRRATRSPLGRCCAWRWSRRRDCSGFLFAPCTRRLPRGSGVSCPSSWAAAVRRRRREAWAPEV